MYGQAQTITYTVKFRECIRTSWQIVRNQSEIQAKNLVASLLQDENVFYKDIYLIDEQSDKIINNWKR